MLLNAQDPDPEQLVNMNEAGDHHVSFSARHLALSADGRCIPRSHDLAHSEGLINKT